MDVPLEQKNSGRFYHERTRQNREETNSFSPFEGTTDQKKKSGARDLKRVGEGVGVSAGNKTGKGEEEGRRMARKRERL